ncbi:MAG: hypothetical protein ACKPKO_45180, partial [Candidatus Fonsibacter sp.]
QEHQLYILVEMHQRSVLAPSITALVQHVIKTFANNILAYNMNRSAGTAYYHKPRGSWLIKQI